MKLIDIIVPCYNEEEVLPLFIEETNKVIATLPDYDFRYIFVNDGSRDGTLRVLRELAAKYSNAKYISFSRNFGKESAMYAGLENSTGDYVIVMDADLQHPPAMFPQMIQGVEEGYDCCAANRATRDGDPILRTLFTRVFYRFVNKISVVEMPDGAGDFRMMSRPMVNAIIAMSEVQRFSKGIFSWVGFKTKWIKFENVERAAGQTKWNFWKLFAYSLEGIVAFSAVPLQIAALAGVFFCILAFVMIIFTIVRRLLFGDPVSGWPSLVCIILLTSGVQFFCTGILGQYLARTYLEVKRRPIYLVKEEF